MQDLKRKNRDGNRAISGALVCRIGGKLTIANIGSNLGEIAIRLPTTEEGTDPYLTCILELVKVSSEVVIMSSRREEATRSAHVKGSYRRITPSC